MKKINTQAAVGMFVCLCVCMCVCVYVVVRCCELCAYRVHVRVWWFVYECVLGVCVRACVLCGMCCGRRVWCMLRVVLCVCVGRVPFWYPVGIKEDNKIEKKCDSK